MKLKQLNIRAAAHDELLITMMLLVAQLLLSSVVVVVVVAVTRLTLMARPKQRERAPVSSPRAAKLFARLPSSFC